MLCCTSRTRPAPCTPANQIDQPCGQVLQLHHVFAHLVSTRCSVLSTHAQHPLFALQIPFPRLVTHLELHHILHMHTMLAATSSLAQTNITLPCRCRTRCTCRTWRCTPSRRHLTVLTPRAYAVAALQTITCACWWWRHAPQPCL